jgi:hypothetical protein
MNQLENLIYESENIQRSKINHFKVIPLMLSTYMHSNPKRLRTPLFCFR